MKGFIKVSIERTSVMTSETKQTVNVYTLPVCPNCTVLKKSLLEHGISFEEHDMDSPQSDDSAYEGRLYDDGTGAAGQRHVLDV